MESTLMKSSQMLVE